ncbi:MAG: hypothetical protein AB7P76_13060 [Candidatus Melainabacteria bacterium]
MTQLHQTHGHSPRAAGQAGVLAIAALVLAVMVFIGASLSQMSFMGTKRTVVTSKNLQSYYVAMAGVQNALATRFYPASNYLSWNAVNDVKAIEPYPTQSGTPSATAGYVYRNPASKVTGQLVGVYQYFILGGYQGVDAGASSGNNFSYWSDNRKIELSQFPDSDAARFLVVSRGVTCNLPTGAAQAGVIQPNKLFPGKGPIAPLKPTCPSGFVADDTTIVAPIWIRPASGGSDKVEAISVFDDSTAIRLPRKTFVPGSGWQNAGSTINFDTVYADATSNVNSAVTPTHVAIYDFVTNQLQCQKNINGAATTLAGGDCTSPINAKSVINIYFKGHLDHRSFNPNNAWDLKSCTYGNCNLEVESGGTASTGYQLIFDPIKSDQIKLLPNISSLATANKTYTIHIKTNQLRGWSGASATIPEYTVQFTLPPAP